MHAYVCGLENLLDEAERVAHDDAVVRHQNLQHLIEIDFAILIDFALLTLGFDLSAHLVQIFRVELFIEVKLDKLRNPLVRDVELLLVLVCVIGKSSPAHAAIEV